MDQLAAGIFTEQEPVLASMLAEPPNYNREVIGFAERIKRRTTLSFLTVLAADGNVLSDSRRPALFGIRGIVPMLPEQEPVILNDPEITLQVRRTAKFGKRQLILQMVAYFLTEEWMCSVSRNTGRSPISKFKFHGIKGCCRGLLS